MNVTRFVRDHDRLVREAAEITPELVERHREVRDFVHRERAIHLQVTLAVGLFALLALGLALIRPSLPSLLLVILLCGLELAYIRHYFLLENHVQAWTGLLLEWEGRHPSNPVAPRDRRLEGR
ncbi:MAG: hypothetical protein JXB39_01370 [Deltaproteobacteria bacterium]|nr:hypothetical protein [Deltaproteobacteria bacterium]